MVHKKGAVNFKHENKRNRQRKANENKIYAKIYK